MAVRKAGQQSQSPPTAKQTGTSATRLSRGPVDAPGKRHRKPPPQEPIDKRMGEPRGKQMGQNVKNPVEKHPFDGANADRRASATINVH